MPGGLDTLFFPGRPVFCGYPCIYILVVAVVSVSLWSPNGSICDNGIWVMEAIPLCRHRIFSLKRLKNNHPDVPIYPHSFNASSFIALLKSLRITLLTPLSSSQLRASSILFHGRYTFSPDPSPRTPKCRYGYSSSLVTSQYGRGVFGLLRERQQSLDGDKKCVWRKILYIGETKKPVHQAPRERFSRFSVLVVVYTF